MARRNIVKDKNLAYYYQIGQRRICRKHFTHYAGVG
jgi:hypothetical protein